MFSSVGRTVKLRVDKVSGFVLPRLRESRLRSGNSSSLDSLLVVRQERVAASKHFGNRLHIVTEPSQADDETAQKVLVDLDLHKRYTATRIRSWHQADPHCSSAGPPARCTTSRAATPRRDHQCQARPTESSQTATAPHGGSVRGPRNRQTSAPQTRRSERRPASLPAPPGRPSWRPGGR
jgi:hypothetical protein